MPSLLSQSAFFLSNVDHTTVLPSTEALVVSFANQVKQAMRMDRVAREHQSRIQLQPQPLTSASGKGDGIPAAAVDEQTHQLGEGHGGDPFGTLNASEAVWEIKNAESLVKVLYEAQLLSTEMQSAVSGLHEAHKRVAFKEAVEQRQLQQDAPEMLVLKEEIAAQQGQLEMHKLLRRYKAQLDYYEALIVESNLMDLLVGRADKNYAASHHTAFFEKIKLKRSFIAALKGHQTQTQFAQETKAGLQDILNHFAVGNWEVIKFQSGPSVSALLLYVEKKKRFPIDMIIL